MNLKRTLIALVAAGGVGVIAFGGSAVSTQFSADSGPHSIAANSATLQTVGVTGGDIVANNLFPGEPQTFPVVVTNGGTHKVVVTVNFGSFSWSVKGTNGHH